MTTLERSLALLRIGAKALAGHELKVSSFLDSKKEGSVGEGVERR